MIFIYFILSCLPSFIHVPARRLLGHSIGKKTKLRLGSLIISNDLKIGKNVRIGPFIYIKTKKLSIDDHSVIKPLSVISTKTVRLGQYVHIAPLSVIKGDFSLNSIIEIGDHSRIFPFCWLETGEGITIGKHVGVGGHSLIFTHGSWTDYIDGGPVSFGPVVIKDNVWLPWRVFILPNVEIGKNSIIGANSLVNKSVENNTLAAGSPIKVIKENILEELEPGQKTKRAMEIIMTFASCVQNQYGINSKIENETLCFKDFKISVDNMENMGKGDLIILINSELDDLSKQKLLSQKISILEHRNKSITVSTKNYIIDDLISFIRKYGIRLYIHKKY